jgi:hypothetical protein
MEDVMNDTKPALTSTTVWGAIVAAAGALAPVILNTAGVTAAEQATGVAAASQLVGGIGALVALFGRLRATKRLT